MWIRKGDALGALRAKVGHDRGLAEAGWKPLWVVDFPMFEYDDEAKTYMERELGIEEANRLTDEYVSTLTRGIPWGRAGTPRDIADAALFLASPYADYVTGEVLGVNGGAMAGRAHLPLSTAAVRKKESTR